MSYAYAQMLKSIEQIFSGDASLVLAIPLAEDSGQVAATCVLATQSSPDSFDGVQVKSRVGKSIHAFRKIFLYFL